VDAADRTGLQQREERLRVIRAPLCSLDVPLIMNEDSVDEHSYLRADEHLST